MHGRHFDSPNQNQDIFSIRAPIRRDKEAPINRYNYNFSTRAPLRPVQLCNGAASVGLNPLRKGNFVSIRTPVWGVAENFTNRIVPAEISIHAPRAGSDGRARRKLSCACLFQSTLPVRGATITGSFSVATYIFQSTLPVRGATQGGAVYRCERIFQSTLPVRGATLALKQQQAHTRNISIHAPRAGSDYMMPWFLYDTKDISIHAPRAGSDRPVVVALPLFGIISIHAPRAGSDQW